MAQIDLENDWSLMVFQTPTKEYGFSVNPIQNTNRTTVVPKFKDQLNIFEARGDKVIYSGGRFNHTNIGPVCKIAGGLCDLLNRGYSLNLKKTLNTVF